MCSSDLLIEATPINADTHRLIMATRDFNHFTELLIALFTASDIARINTELGQRPGAGNMLLEQFMTIEMKIADYRYPAILSFKLFDNMWHRAGRGVVIHGYAHQLRAGIVQQFYLGNRGRDIGGVGVGHRLHYYWRVTADDDTGNVDAMSVTGLAHETLSANWWRRIV